MTLASNELFSSGAGRGSEIRMVQRRNKVGTLAAQSGSPTLPKGTPLAWDTANSLWTVYTQPSDAAIYTITADGTAASAGTFDLVIDGLVVELAFDVAAAALQTAVNAVLADAGKSYTVSAAATTGTDLGDNSAVITITFGENAGAPSVAVDVSDLTGNVHVLAATDAGTQLNGTNEIRGFLADVDGVATDASGEVQVVVMLEGDVHRDDINTTAIRAVLGGSPSEAELDTALRAQSLRALGIHVRGLSNVS